MPPFADLAIISLRVVSGIVFATVILVVLRDISKRDSILGTIVAGGVLIRAAIGVTLFWISYLDLPVLASLHTGDGFWQLAPDARSYHRLAERAVREGWDVIAPSSASPAFTRLLAAWMWIVGISPATGLFLNVFLFALSAWLVVRVFRPVLADRFPLVLFLAGYSYLPAAVLFSVQALKDQLVIALVACLGAGIWLWSSSAMAQPQRPIRRWGQALVILAVFMIGGIRPYFAALVVFAFATASLSWIASARSVSGRLRTTASSAGWILVLWMAFAAGSGPYHAYYDSMVARAVGLEGSGAMMSPFSALQQARKGFVRSGGDTNIAQLDEVTGEDAVGVPLGRGGAVRRLLLGIAVIFVPIHVVQWTGEIALRGGRGLLLVTDIDTLLVLLITVLSVAYLMRRRSWAPGGKGLLVFCAVLGTTTLLLMAFVVTNYGTLFRLRLFPLIALWMIPLAAASIRPVASVRTRLPDANDVSVAVPQANAH